ncbi:MAG: TRAP transporter substrate-binding protein DctP [Alphaproteobacteria bacterium]|nr:TRAP transporter substrate-binding protein DctP [Alphaproteobacteria bacterium]MCB9929938.1 TRAP transporter substrate-binding protein DctP [Alphaproteobacteria bacterium]
MKVSLKTMGGAAAVATALLAGSASAADVEWRITSTWPTGINLSDADNHFVKLVNDLGGDRFQVKYFPGGALVGAMEVFDTASAGNVDATIEWAGYWAGRDSAFALLGAYPMLFTLGDYRIWYQDYGGRELFDEVYGKFNMKYLLLNVINMESGIRSSKPLKTLEDLKGLRIRMSGRPQGVILDKLGAVQVQLPGGEVYQALERGVIDAAEFSTPGVDWSLGFQEITTNWMVPGWHQPGSTGGIAINLDSWNALDDWTKNLLRTAADATLAWTFGHFERINAEKTTEFVKRGTEVDRISDAELDRLQGMANAVLVEQSCENPLFAKVAYSQVDFLQKYRDWRAMAAPFGVGRNIANMPDLEAIKKCMDQ